MSPMTPPTWPISSIAVDAICAMADRGHCAVGVDDRSDVERGLETAAEAGANVAPDTLATLVCQVDEPGSWAEPLVALHLHPKHAPLESQPFRAQLC